MKHSLIRLGCITLVAMGVVSCTNRDITGNAASGNEAMVASGDNATGSVGSGSMDSIDRNKLSHALDKTIGKQTTWQNASTGVTYTVVPTRKTTVGSNSLCREYTVTKAYGGNSSASQGVACVGSDGAWHPA